MIKIDSNKITISGRGTSDVSVRACGEVVERK